MDSTTPNIVLQAGEAARAKAAAKEALIAADRFLKERQFDKARAAVDRARAIDPQNPYLSAFEERINTFEIKTTAGKPSPAPFVPGTPPPPPPERLSFDLTTRLPEPEPPAPPAPGAWRGRESGGRPAPAPAAAPSGEFQTKLDQMSRQIADLSQALLNERQTREEILKKQLEASLRQYRAALRKAWQFGPPKPAEVESLTTLARSLNLEDDVELSVTREVKLEMYGNAVKEALSKRKLLRSSTSTLDWLRKVYQISMTEYLEYESNFLLDLVSGQFRGTLLLVAASDGVRKNLGVLLKNSGFAVVTATCPEEALEKIERISPTIIVCETQFPGRAVSGLTLLQLMRPNIKFTYVPFILLCEEAEVAQLQSSEMREVEGFTPKPVDFDELNGLITEKLQLLKNYLSAL